MITFLRRFFRGSSRALPLDEIGRALQFLAAIDAGGVPLDPRRIARIAEDLGLEVSRKARPEDTIARVRIALARHANRNNGC